MIENRTNSPYLIWVFGTKAKQKTIEQQFEHFDSGQNAAKYETIITTTSLLKSSYESDIFGDGHQQIDIDEARYNLATRIMSNGVEVIIASDKTKTLEHLQYALPSHQMQHNSNNKPMTLAASTIKNQMMILVVPSSTATDRLQDNYTQQLEVKLPFHTNHFITKTCLTTYTYRTTYVQNGETTVESREKVISNIATEERNYPEIVPSQAMGVTLTRTPDMAVGIFPTTYLYFNTFKDNNHNFQVMTSEHTVMNTVTGPDDYIAYLLPTENATPVLETNTYYNKVTLIQTLKEPISKNPHSIATNIHTMEEMLTQVIVTKSLPPACSTLTSFYTLNDVKFPEISTENVDEIQSDKTTDLDDIHIYATKKFLTTFTYYITSILNSTATESPSASITPMSTVFTYHTRVIENVITDSIPVRLLPTEFVSKMKLELRKQKHQRLVIVTTATLKGGKTLKITAMKMFMPSIRTHTPSTSLSVITQEHSVYPLATGYQSASEAHFENTTREYTTAIGDNQVGQYDQKTPLYEESIASLENLEPTEETDVLETLSSEKMSEIIEAPKNYTLPEKLYLESTTAKPTVTNNLIQRLTALRPMFNAVAGLLQNNFGVGVETVKPIESKQAALHKKIMSNMTLEAHPMYIPVQKPYLANSQYNPNVGNHRDFIPLSLHIKPPLVSEMTLQSNDKENWLMPPEIPTQSHGSNTSLVSLTGPRQEQLLQNGIIYIHPGEVITANSDVIVGRPNGIEYVHIPSELNDNSAITTTNVNAVDTNNNNKNHVTYYHHNIQHSYKKKSPLETHRHQHVQIGGASSNNNELNSKFLQQHFRLRPPMHELIATEDFNKNILKPPPLPNSKLHLQSLLNFPGTPNGPHSIPLKSESLYSTSPIPYAGNRIVITSSINKMASYYSQTPHRDLHNLYHLNNVLKNNDILEIKRIPEVFSTDLNPSPVFYSHFSITSRHQHQFQNQKNENHEGTGSNLFSEKKLTTLAPKNHLISFNLDTNHAINSTNFDEIYRKNVGNSGFSSTFPTVVSSTLGNPIAVNDEPQSNDLADAYKKHNSLVASKNRQRVNLDTNVLSHTVDVNVPPLTFNRDYDYPQYAIPVKGQIQSSIPLIPPDQTNYMPLIKIPANKQQIQINLTPFNMISLRPTHIATSNEEIKTHIEVPTKSPQVSKTSPYYNSNIFKDDHGVQDQKMAASGNIFISKADRGSQTKWNHPHIRHHLPSPQESNIFIKQKQSPINSPSQNTMRNQIMDSKLTVSDFPLTTYYQSKPMGDWVHYKKFNNNDTIPTTQSMPQFGLNSYEQQKLLSKVIERNPILVSFDAKKNKSFMKAYEDLKHKDNWLTFQLTDLKTATDEQHDLFNDYSKELLPQKILSKNNDTTTRVLSVKQIQNEVVIPQSYQRQHNDEIASKIPKRSQEKFTKRISITKSPLHTQTTFERNNEIVDLAEETIAAESQKPSLVQGKPFTKLFNNRSANINNTSRTQSGIYVAAGEAFKVPSTESPKDEYVTKEIVITHETQPNAKQSSLHKLQPQIQSTTSKNFQNITLKELATNIRPPPLFKTAATETVLGLTPPPFLTSVTSTIPHQTELEKFSKSDNKNPPEARKRQQNRPQFTPNPFDSTPSESFAERPHQLLLSSTQLPKIISPFSKIKYNKIERLSTTTTKANLEKLQHDKINETFHTDKETSIFQANVSHVPEEKFKYNLKPSATYSDVKISSIKSSPFLTTSITTKTFKRIVSPTKYKTITSASPTKPKSPLEHKLTKSHAIPTMALKSTIYETTTSSETLLVSHTESTSVDTMNSLNINTTISPTVTISNILTPTPKSQTVSPEDQNLEKSHGKAANHLPYPSVEIVSTNISKERTPTESIPHQAMNNNENSIFIVLGNNKNKSVPKSPTSTEITDIPLKLETENEDINEIAIDYDDTISFDAIPTRDEEPIHTVNGKSVPSNSKSIGSSASENHVFLSGVLLATPPKIPSSQSINVNLNESVISCRPECKSIRNEVCALVDKYWTCICRPGFARMFPDRTCKPTYTYALQMHAERVGNYPLKYVQELSDYSTEHFQQLSKLLVNALDRMVMQSDFRDVYHGVHLTQILDDEKTHQGIMAKFLLQLSDNSEEKRLEEVFKKYLRLSNYSIGGTDVYTNKARIDALAIDDFDECHSKKFHDCSKDAHCFNLRGTYTCSCREGFADLSHNLIYPGRLCSSKQIGCEQCHYHGKCASSFFSTKDLTKSSDRTFCECFPWYTGATCHVNLKILLIVLLGIGTILIILLLFCCLITCTKRHKYQHTTLATSTMTSTNVSGSAGSSFHKNSHLATNLLLTRDGVRLWGSIENGFGTSNGKRKKSITLDKRSMIKDSSSESSQNSLPYILKTKESFSGSYSQKKPLHMSYSKKYSNDRPRINGNDQQMAPSSNNHLGSQNYSNSSIPLRSTPQQYDDQTTKNGADVEGHYFEQSDRSLTVMIPRAKYHSSVYPQNQVMHHQFTVERTYNTSTADNNMVYVDKNSEYKFNQVSSTSSFTGENLPAQIPSNPGALISAGFEVSAIVSDHINVISSLKKKNNDLVFLEPTTTYSSETSLDPVSSMGTNQDQKPTQLDGRRKIKSSKQILTNNLETKPKSNINKCEKDLFETMGDWLGNVKSNELSAEARSFDETTVRATTKPMQVCNDDIPTQQLNDEANTMAERDLGSTFLLPHTHLYKPERQESEMSGFDSL